MRRQTALFALWILAGLFAVLLALGPTPAAAHPGHEGHATAHRTVHAANPVSSSAVTQEPSALSPAASAPNAETVVVAAAVFEPPGPAMSCHAKCCSGIGCCAAACIAVDNSTLPLIRPFAILGLSNVLAVDGTSPDFLLEPPNALA